MVMVGTDRAEVERSLVSGGLSCPSCQGVLAPWGYARSRSSRGPDGTVRHQPRRARCTSVARGTHVLLARVWLRRRADAVSVIGAALEAKAAGAGHRSQSRQGWAGRCRRCGAGCAASLPGPSRSAPSSPGCCWRWTRSPAADPAGSVFADAVEAIGRAAAAAVLRLSPAPPWEVAAPGPPAGGCSPRRPRAGGEQHELTLPPGLPGRAPSDRTELGRREEQG